MQLTRNERFLKEYADFKNKIDRIKNENIKIELTSILGQLLNEVRSIDQAHRDVLLTNKMPSALNDSKDKIQALRKKIFTKLQDCERANLLN